jgi:hypothetical protein
MKKIPGAVLEAFNMWKALPLVFFAVFPVLIVRVKFVSVTPEATALWLWPYFGDTRSWWKAVAVISAGAWMVVHAAFLLVSGWRPGFRRLGLFAALAAAATLTSALLSPFPKTAWLGYTGLYEGALVLFSYLVAVWYAAEVADTRGRQWNLVRLIGCVGMFESGHGLLEGMGINFWMTAPGRWLMGGGELEATFAFADSNMAYGTVYQPNHYGMLMAMLTMLALGMVQMEVDRKWKVFWGLHVILGLTAVVASNSRTALAICGCLIAAYVLRIVIPPVVRRRRQPASWPGGGILGIAALLLTVVASFMGIAFDWVGAGAFGDRVRGLVGRVRETFIGDREYYLKAAGLQNGAIVLTTTDGAAEIVRHGKADWRFRWAGNDAQQEKLSFSRQGRIGYEADIPQLREGKIFLSDNGDVRIDINSETLWYYSLNDALFAVDHKGCLYPETSPADAVRFGGLEKYLGGRGQTWGLGLALVPQNPWFGTGPGSFGLVFPNHEILIKRRYLDSLDEDKGHGVWNTFLVQLGIVGTLSYALLIGYVLLRKPWAVSPLGLPIAMGIGAYLMGAVTNDSTVGVTPVFCVLLGLMASQKRIIASQNIL